MIKKIFTGAAACALVACPLAFAQSTSDDWEAPARPAGSAYAQADADVNVVRTEPINIGQALIAPNHEPVEVPVPEAALDRLAGKYIAPNRSLVIVTRVGNHLAADMAGVSLEFAPSAPNEFFSQGSPLTLSFVASEAGKAQEVVVKENGMAIIQATPAR